MIFTRVNFYINKIIPWFQFSRLFNITPLSNFSSIAIESELHFVFISSGNGTINHGIKLISNFFLNFYCSGSNGSLANLEKIISFFFYMNLKIVSISMTQIKRYTIISKILSWILEADSNIIKVINKVLIIHKEDSIIFCIVVAYFILGFLVYCIPNWITITKSSFPFYF